MSNDVQSHEAVAERVSGGERRDGLRHAAQSLGSVTARIIGGSQVDLVNFSSRGVLFECDSRLLIGARASVRITTTDANIIVTGRVVRSRVKGLVNGALRYDAALVLDSELALAPAIIEAAPAAEDLEFESDFADPSPVEAYVAESEASLLEVASDGDLPLHESLVEPVASAAEADVAEPVAFEADTEIAFEPAVEFAFDEFAEVPADAPAEPEPVDVIVVERIVIDEPAGASMFDSTYIPPTYEIEASAEPMFEVTPPTPVADAPAAASPFFDARPSENFGDAAEAVAVESPRAAAEGVDFETEVAFEAADAVMFEPSFDDAAAAAPPDPPAIDEASTDDIDTPAAVPDTEDRVLLQFAATVPHDLAELRRIAADNQW